MACWGVEVRFHAFLTSALDGSEWLPSRPGRFTPRERAPGTHWIGVWVGPIASLLLRNDGKHRYLYVYTSLYFTVQSIQWWTLKSWDSSVSIVTELRTERPGFDSVKGPTQPPIHRGPGTLPLGVKRPVREADHPPLPSGEIFMAWCLIKRYVAVC
jgi:hypothetical protein